MADPMLALAARDAALHTTAPAYLSHHPVVGSPDVLDMDDSVSVLGCSCGQTPGEDLFGRSWFAEHLGELGAPGYLVGYWGGWSHITERAGGIDRDAVARELSDYGVVMEQASEVFCELAGLSKPNTRAAVILAAAEERYAAYYAGELCANAAAVDGIDPGGADLADALRAIAEEWHPGAWEAYQQEVARRRPRPDVEVGDCDPPVAGGQEKS